MLTQIPETKEKIGAMLAYMTLGVWALVWLLLSKTPSYNQKDFVKFHCFQSIFIGILFMFIPSGLAIFFSLITQIINFIPGTSMIITALKTLHYSMSILFQWLSLGLLIYASVFALRGKYTNIPYISQMINRMLR